MDVLDPLCSGYDISHPADVTFASTSRCHGLCGFETRSNALGKVLRQGVLEIREHEVVGCGTEAKLEEGRGVLNGGLSAVARWRYVLFLGCWKVARICR